MKTTTLISVLLLLALCCTTAAQKQQIAAQFETAKFTDHQHYRVSFSSKLDPIVINTMHTWVIHIENKIGQPVLNAEVNVIGGMPEHDHGLPTYPQVTQNLGEGTYLLEGMKFHMHGWWTVTIEVSDGNISDGVTFDLTL